MPLQSYYCNRVSFNAKIWFKDLMGKKVFSLVGKCKSLFLEYSQSKSGETVEHQSEVTFGIQWNDWVFKEKKYFFSTAIFKAVVLDKWISQNPIQSGPRFSKLIWCPITKDLVEIRFGYDVNDIHRIFHWH